MITSVRGCVAYNDIWPWPISSRSFGLGLENHVRSVASTVPDGFFPYLAQMITRMRRCVACDDLWPWPISSRSFDLVLIWDPTWFNSVGNHEAAGGYPQNAGVLVVLVTFLILIFPSLPFWLSIDYFMYLKHVIFRWLLRKRYIHTLVRVSWHNYVCILNRSCIVGIQLYLSLIMSNKLFWSWRSWSWWCHVVI